MQASICPMCRGLKEVSRWVYEEAPEMVTYDRDESDDIREAAEAAEVVPCRVCSGTGVVWPPAGHVGPLHVTGDVVVTGNVVSSGFKDIQPHATLGAVDFVVPNAQVGSDYWTDQYEPVSEPLPFDVHVTYVYEAEPTPATHPERKRVLDLLATLPEDMPLAVLTPQSRGEMHTMRDFIERLKSGTTALAGAEALLERMRAWATHFYGGADSVPLSPPEVSPRLAGLPVSEGDER